MTDWNPNVEPSAPNPHESTPPTNSQTWQEQARASGWQQPEDNSGFQQSDPVTTPPQTTPVDLGSGSSPMTEPLTPENRSGMSSRDVNSDNGLPDEMSLGEVFSNIKLHPTEISMLLSNWASQHHGGPNQNLSTKLNEEASRVANPATYNNDSNSE